MTPTSPEPCGRLQPVFWGLCVPICSAEGPSQGLWGVPAVRLKEPAVLMVGLTLYQGAAAECPRLRAQRKAPCASGQNEVPPWTWWWPQSVEQKEGSVP